jgi:adenine-specific DNA methylase
VIRGLLIAADLPSSATQNDFWLKFKEPLAHLAGKRVHDMFAGGGAMLVEASRLGATPSGTDVDPLAVEIVRHELDPPSEVTLSPILKRLFRTLHSNFEQFYPSSEQSATPLHYFYLSLVTCPACAWEAPLYKSVVIARDVKKSGGVNRDSVVTAFCPDCFSLRHITNATQKSFRCCAKQWSFDTGTFGNGKYTCPNCAKTSDHALLKTGVSPRRLIAVEETFESAKRMIREPNSFDLKAEASAKQFLRTDAADLLYPSGPLERKRADARPVSYGIDTADKLFTARQLAVFGYAFNWIATQNLDRPVRRALRLALSNALTTNNRLCSYATDYGRIAPLFSIRSYAMPWLSVELNPLHETAGRGTLSKSFRKIVRSSSTTSIRSVWNPEKNSIERIKFTFPAPTAKPTLRCISATYALNPAEAVDICLFDPPYFDYIAYSELSEFYRVWHSKSALGGVPLLPQNDRPSESFGNDLGNCLIQTLKVLRKNKPLTFTFHSLDPEAWKAIAIALQKAQTRITAIWPMLNDAHMGHHGASGNCEWDLVVVCRRSTEVVTTYSAPSIAAWKTAVKPLKIGKADERGMRLALDALKDLFATY